MPKANRGNRGVQILIGICAFAMFVGVGSSSAQQIVVNTNQRPLPQNSVTEKHSSGSDVATAVDTQSVSPAVDPGKPVRSRSEGGAKGPYYVDFRARTAASYGHAFIWFGKTNQKKVEVAGLHPAGDETPYILGHFIWVPAETGASYGDLDIQYLTASYRVYLNEPDAKKVFAYIKHLQATSKVWNAATSNCTSFIGQIASFMGLKVPFHVKKPEEYVKDLKEMNGGRQTAQLTSDR